MSATDTDEERRRAVLEFHPECPEMVRHGAHVALVAIGPAIAATLRAAKTSARKIGKSRPRPEITPSRGTETRTDFEVLTVPDSIQRFQ